jgi:Tol biopolymer transport system component
VLIALCAQVGILGGCGAFKSFPEPLVEEVDEKPSWSNDGSLIAYVHFNPDIADTVAPTGIYITDLAGAATCVVAAPTARSVDWSPDGRWLVFDDTAGLHVIRSTGDSANTIYDGGIYPSWSPLGSEIAFSTTSRIWGIRPDGTGLRPLTPADSIALDPDWSPDGQQLVVLGDPHSIGEEVMIAPVSGTGLRRITEDAHEDRSPVWSPRGDRIAWNALMIGSDNRIHPEIRVVDTLGANPRRVVSAAAAPSWDPTGLRLAFSQQTGDGVRLFIVHTDGTGLMQVTH